MSVATSLDVEASLMRQLNAGESVYVQTLLERAEARLLARIPDLAARAEADTTFNTNVVAVEAEAVARVFRSPGAGRLKSETEGNYSYQLNMMVASGLLDILPAEWDLLLPAEQAGISVAGPDTDLYLAARRGRACDPADQFQCCWPAHDSMSDRVEGPAL